MTNEESMELRETSAVVPTGWLCRAARDSMMCTHGRLSSGDI